MRLSVMLVVALYLSADYGRCLARLRKYFEVKSNTTSGLTRTISVSARLPGTFGKDIR